MNTADDFLKEGILIDPEVREDLKNMQVPFVEIVKALDIRFLSKSSFSEYYEKLRIALENLKDRKDEDEKEQIEKSLKYLETNFAANAPKKTKEKKDEEAKACSAPKMLALSKKVKVIKSYDLPPREISVADFTDYFKARYNLIKAILQDHGELSNLTLINKLPSQSSRDISIIGMVYSKSVTKNKNVMLKMEDLSGRISVVVSVNKPELMKKCNEVVLDEVIGIKCGGSSEILFANDIIFPEFDTLSAKRRRSKDEEYAAFTADTHVGSNVFLEKGLNKFIEWINGESGTPEQRVEAKKIKYLFIIGDTVDGVGVNPGQEARLAIKDIRAQYEKLAEYLGKIRKDITIILCPGQHDAVRVSEPQPPIGKDYGEALHKLDNVLLVSNPALVEIGDTGNGEGVRVLIYHGASYHTLIDDIEELRFGEARFSPTKVTKHVLKKRHLGPQHTTTTKLPTPGYDSLVIREVPEIVATGDLHRADVANHKGLLLISGSCWQSITPFEEKVGNVPDPCKVPIVNLKTWEAKILDFTD